VLLDAPEGIDWKTIRNDNRDAVGALIRELWSTIYTPLNNLWSAVVTYQEGLLCSACQPNFDKFMDVSGNVKMQSPAAGEVADAFITSMHSYDAFIAKNTDKIKQLSGHICQEVSKNNCNWAAVVASSVINDFSNLYLRAMLCGANAKTGTIEVRDAACKDFVMNKALRGLTVDVSAVINNIFDHFTSICLQVKVVDCSKIDSAKQKSLEWSFTFDERPLATNVYSPEGFDVKQVACSSNLSGYACGGAGPRPEIHGKSSGTGNSGPVIITIVVLVTVSSLGGVLFISRHRIRQVTQSWYTRIRDDGMGPTVGLV